MNMGFPIYYIKLPIHPAIITPDLPTPVNMEDFPAA
jgi:hypothetical protein